MKEVVVATDSAANLPQIVVEQLGIEVIPLWIRMDDESYRDGVDIQPLDFFQRLQQQFRRLQTSQPSLGEFLEFYRRIQERARSIVSVHVAGRYSGVLQVARAAAAEMAPYPIEVVDTGTIAMAQGFVAMAAARAAAAGAAHAAGVPAQAEAGGEDEHALFRRYQVNVLVHDEAAPGAASGVKRCAQRQSRRPQTRPDVCEGRNDCFVIAPSN